MYVPSDPTGGQSQHATNVICNDLSVNQLEGFNYDGKNVNNSPYFYGYPGVYQLSHNRVLNNKADGIRYYLDPTPSGQQQYLDSRRTFNNHIQGNGSVPNPAYAISGYGLNVNGFFYHGFFANNFVGNNLGPARDANPVMGVENEYDESPQYERAYDNQYCKYQTACNYDSDCGAGYPGTCVNNLCQAPVTNPPIACSATSQTCQCYANPQALSGAGFGAIKTYYTYPAPYVPVGNYGLPSVVPTSAAPPLSPTSCANPNGTPNDGLCTTKSCEAYPAPVNNTQCGNGDTLGSLNQFGGYYRPPFTCPTAFYYPVWTSIFTTPPHDPTPPPENQGSPPPENIKRILLLVPKEYRPYLEYQLNIQERYVAAQQKAKLLVAPATAPVPTPASSVAPTNVFGKIRAAIKATLRK